MWNRDWVFYLIVIVWAVVFFALLYFASSAIVRVFYGG
jgi:RsiW-degrading membrane proteinase PrsW (M82 family)